MVEEAQHIIDHDGFFDVVLSYDELFSSWSQLSSFTGNAECIQSWLTSKVSLQREEDSHEFLSRCWDLVQVEVEPLRALKEL